MTFHSPPQLITVGEVVKNERLLYNHRLAQKSLFPLPVNKIQRRSTSLPGARFHLSPEGCILLFSPETAINTAKQKADFCVVTITGATECGLSCLAVVC